MLPSSFQDFNDVALTPMEAANVLHNFEKRTGHLLSMQEVEGGFLKGRLQPEDYVLTPRVSTPFSLTSGYLPTALEGL